MRLFLFLLVFGFTNKASAQLDQKSSTVLQKTQKAIAALHNFSYDLTREYKYPSGNYDVTKKGKIYFYKNKLDSILGYNVYSISKEYTSIYENFQGFTLVHEDSTVEIDKRLDSASIASNSFVSYSMVSIQKLIPQLLQESNSPSITTSDSSIKGKKYFKVKIITQNGYYDFYSFAKVEEKDFVREIFILIDATTFLPYQYFVQFKVTSYGVDFLRNTYTNIKTNIAPIADNKWEPGNSMPPYKIKVDNEKQKLIAVGDTFPTKNLQKYSPKGSSTVSTSSFTNTKTIFYFWIKSCGPCVASFPKLIAFQKKNRNNGIEVVMVNCYDKEKDIAFFYNKHQPNYAMLYNGLALQNKIGVNSYPTVVIVDKNQKVLYSGNWEEAAKVALQ
jgi:thiol-disulfide isomerase/thioredoxin